MRFTIVSSSNSLWFSELIDMFWFSLSHFSFDVRGRQFGQAKLWSSPTVFGSRAFFSTASSPAQLKVDNIQLADEGMYRCRVDFRNSPTRNLKINLTVIGKCLLPLFITFSTDFDVHSMGPWFSFVHTLFPRRPWSWKMFCGNQFMCAYERKLTFLHKFECDSHVCCRGTHTAFGCKQRNDRIESKSEPENKLATGDAGESCEDGRERCTRAHNSKQYSIMDKHFSCCAICVVTRFCISQPFGVRICANVWITVWGGRRK